MKRIFPWLVLGYLALALIGLAEEAAGMIACTCYPDCWCRKPFLRLFRWAFPFFHRLPEPLEEMKLQGLLEPKV